MSGINFEFVKQIDAKRVSNKNKQNNKKFYNELKKSSEILNSNPKEAINKVNFVAAEILIDIINKEKLQECKNQSFERKISYLKGNVSRNERFIFDMFKMLKLTHNDYSKSNLKIDYEWTNLCMEYIYMICKWYGEKYYNNIYNRFFNFVLV